MHKYNISKKIKMSKKMLYHAPLILLFLFHYSFIILIFNEIFQSKKQKNVSILTIDSNYCFKYIDNNSIIILCIEKRNHK